MKRTRVSSCGWGSLPTAVSTIIWSFIHILDAPLLVPDREQRRACRLAQRQLSWFRFDRRWADELTPASSLKQLRLAHLMISRYSRSSVQYIELVLDDFEANVPIFLLPVCEYFKGATKVGIWSTNQFNAEAVNYLCRSETITELRLFPETVSTSKALLSSVRSTKLKRLSTGSPETVLSTFTPRETLRGIEHLDNITYNLQHAADLLDLMPRLRRVDMLFSGLNNGADLAHAGRMLTLHTPSLQTVHLAFRDDAAYPTSETLAAFLGLRRLRDFAMWLQMGAKWARTKDPSYDAFLRTALVTWAELETLRLCLPVTDEFWAVPASGGASLREFGVFQPVSDTAVVQWANRLQGTLKWTKRSEYSAFVRRD